MGTKSGKYAGEGVEQMAADIFGAGQACLVSNGTHAIEVLLTALDLPRGAKVLVPELSFMATATAVARCGLIPVYADVSMEHLGLTLSSVKNHAKDVSAVIVVHLAGLVNRQLREIALHCHELGIPLIEDCAQAHMAYYEGLHVGNYGVAATFSFQSSKLFNCGEGGLITSNDERIIKRCRAITNWGISVPGVRGDYALPSSNYRLSAIQGERLKSEFMLAEEKVQSIRRFYLGVAAEACELNIEYIQASFSDTFVDSPFFFVAKGVLPVHQLEPRGQYPMSGSSVVLAILAKWFPDLVHEYSRINIIGLNPNSVKIINSYAFIRLSEYKTVSDAATELGKLVPEAVPAI